MWGLTKYLDKHKTVRYSQPCGNIFLLSILTTHAPMDYEIHQGQIIPPRFMLYMITVQAETPACEAI